MHDVLDVILAVSAGTESVGDTLQLEDGVQIAWGLLGAVATVEIGANRGMVGASGNANPPTIALVGGSTQAVGNLLFTQYLLPFEIISLVLLIGVVGAIVGGFVSVALGYGDVTGFNVRSLVIADLGAIGVIIVFRAVTAGRGSRGGLI